MYRKPIFVSLYLIKNAYKFYVESNRCERIGFLILHSTSKSEILSHNSTLIFDWSMTSRNWLSLRGKIYPRRENRKRREISLVLFRKRNTVTRRSPWPSHDVLLTVSKLRFCVEIVKRHASRIDREPPSRYTYTRRKRRACSNNVRNACTKINFVIIQPLIIPSPPVSRPTPQN